MKKRHSSYDEYVLEHIKEAKADKRKTVPHNEVMDKLAKLIDEIEKKNKKKRGQTE